MIISPIEKISDFFEYCLFRASYGAENEKS